ncbi:hypothetical protein AB0K48_48635, partial [Nonomuraea sp. NPDC055795]
MAAKIEKTIGSAAEVDFASPPPARFAKGISKVNFAEFVGSYATNEGVLLHTQILSTSGRRVDLCLFGSKEHVWGFRPSDTYEAGWVSSAAMAIQELLDSRGLRNTSPWDDDQSRAVEALNIALNQGITGAEEDHINQPWTRGYTLGHADECEWFAEIYVD